MASGKQHDILTIFFLFKKKVKQLLMKLFPWEVTWRSLHGLPMLITFELNAKKVIKFSLVRIRIDANEKNYYLLLIRNQRRFSFRFFSICLSQTQLLFFSLPFISFINIYVIITYIKSKTLYLKHYTFSSFIWNEYFEWVGEYECTK